MDRNFEHPGTALAVESPPPAPGGRKSAPGLLNFHQPRGGPPPFTRGPSTDQPETLTGRTSIARLTIHVQAEVRAFSRRSPDHRQAVEVGLRQRQTGEVSGTSATRRTLDPGSATSTF